MDLRGSSTHLMGPIRSVYADQRFVGRFNAESMLLSAALRSPLPGPLSPLTMSWMLIPLRPRSAVAL